MKQKEEREVLVQVANINNNRLILALDQSTNVTGFAVFYNSKLKHHGTISFGGMDYIDRIIKLCDWVRRFIQDSNINYVAFEDIQLQHGDALTYKKLAQLQGALIFLLKQLDIPFEIVPSTTWKSYHGIKGKKRAEQKANAQIFVNTTFNIVATEDESDAICIGKYMVDKLQ